MERSVRINPLATITSAEGLAILQALQMGYKKEWRKILVFTDSLSIINNLAHNGLNSEMSIIEESEIRELLWMMNKNGNECVINWVPAHVGIVGNEIADKLAKQSVLQTNTEHKDLYVGDMIPIFKKKMLDTTKHLLINYKGNNGVVKGFTFISNLEEFSQVPWFRDKCLSRKQITFINRIRSGHYQLKSHLLRMHIMEEDECECGQGKESLEHIVWECNRLNSNTRNNFVNYIADLNLEVNQNIQKMVILQETTTSLRLLDFLSENNIFL